MRSRVRAAAFALASTLLSAGVAAASPLELQDMSGTPRSVAAFHGRVVVVNFWATWCIPCLDELPLLEELSREYAARDVVFVAASADEASTRSRIPAALAEAGVTFPSWIGATTAHMERLGAGAALPATVILDRDGSVAFRILGPVDEPMMRSRLDWLLAEPRRAEPPALVVNVFEQQESLDADAHGDDAHDHGHDHGHDHDHGEDHAHEESIPAGEDASLVPS